jgi:hypothetical protein
MTRVEGRPFPHGNQFRLANAVATWSFRNSRQSSRIKSATQKRRKRQKMNSNLRRIEHLEKRFLPHPPTAFDIELIARIMAGRERVRVYNEEHGIKPPSDEGLPPKKVHTSRGIQRIMDVLHEGRDRNHLRWLRDKKLREAAALTTTGEDKC